MFSFFHFVVVVVASFPAGFFFPSSFAVFVAFAVSVVIVVSAPASEIRVLVWYIQ